MFGFGKKKPAKSEAKAVKKVVVVKKVPKKKDPKKQVEAANITQTAEIQERTLKDIMTERATSDPESLATIMRTMLLEEQKEANVKLKEKLAQDFGIKGKS